MKAKTETFFTRHVRLLTFLATVTAFLVIVGPFLVLEATDYWGHEGDSRPAMTTQDLIKLSEQNQGITLRQLTQFACDESKMEQQGITIVTIDIEPHYILMAGANNNTGRLEYCEVTSDKTGERVDVLTEDVRAFMQNN